jgi:hypothetical protein
MHGLRQDKRLTCNKTILLSSSRLFVGCLTGCPLHVDIAIKKEALAGCVVILSWFLLRLVAVTLKQDNQYSYNFVPR